MDEHRLLAAARDGDQDAFRRLVEPHLPNCYRTALLIVLDRELARDAVQEALVRLYRSLDRYRPTEPLRPWLNRIVVNEARRMARRQWRQPSLVGELPDLPDATSLGPEDALLARDDREQLWAAISELDDLHRTVLVLRYYQGMSESDMADVLEIKPGTVKSRLHNARRLLQERLCGDSRRPWTHRILHAITGRPS